MRDNATSIIILTIVLFSLLVVSAIYNSSNDSDSDSDFESDSDSDSDSDLDSNSNKNIGKVVTIEAMSDSSFAAAFCNEYKHNHTALEKNCNKMHHKECKRSTCCILLNGKKCVAGNAKGPIFFGHGDKPNINNYWHYKNTCYPGTGKCPQKFKSKKS